MGSSKSGSLDGLAKFSLPAAIGAGKIKLPETGIVGMLQARQEDKMNKGAQMAQQDDNQMTQYMKMMQQQMNPGMNMGGRVGLSEGSGPDMDRVLELEEQGFSYEEAFEKAMQERLDRGYNQGGRVGLSEGGEPSMERVLELEEQGFSYEEAYEKAMQELLDYKGGFAAGGAVESMNFLKQHLPYQDGGHVALRRKMFKLGGPVNTHGVGITSGLEYRNNYNAGGSVRQNYLLGGGVKAGAFGVKILEKLRKLAGKGKPLVDSVTRPYIDPVSYIRGARTAADAKAYQKAFQALTRGVRGAATAGAYGAPVGILSAAADRAGLEYADPDSDVREDANLLERGVRRVRQLGEGLTDYATIPGDALFIGDALTKDPNMEGITLTDLIAGRPREEIASLDKTGQASKSQMTLDELKEQNAAENQARLQQAMEQYAELLAGSDDTDKLATLGDALIAGGSALMEGEGYGAAGRAFNEPLSASRRSKEERMAAANASAAQLAISENMQIDAENRAVVNEFMKTGSFTDAEQAQLMALAQQTGGARLIPENEDGEIDENVVNQPGVYADPKNLSGKGSLFIAIDSSGIPIYTNDPQEAKAHAAS